MTQLISEIEVISEDDSDAIMWVKEKYRTMPDRSIRILYNMHAAEALYIFCRNSSTWGVVYKNLRAANNPVFQKLRMSSGTWDTDWYYAIRFVNNPNDWDALATGQPEGITISDVGIGEANAPKTKGFPVGAYSYGCLVTIVSLRSPDPRDLFRNIQIYIPHHSPGYAFSKLIYIRTLRDSDGKTWRAFSPGEIVDAQTV